MKVTVIAFVLTLMSLSSIKVFAQKNHVSNPSFEILDSCNLQDYAYTLFRAPGWDSLKNGGGWGELFSTCSLFPNSIPLNFAGYQFGRSGKKYSYSVFRGDTSTGYPDQKAYIQNKLSDTLQSGKRYCVTFFLCLVDKSSKATDEIGAYLDDGNISTCWLCAAVATPQVVSPINGFMTDTLNWMQVQGQFVANGTEQYMTLGNFNSYSTTHTIHVNYNSHLGSFSDSAAAYYIDDVSVVESTAKVFAGNDTTITIGDTVVLGLNTTLGLPCEWYDIQGNKIAASSIATVVPKTTTKYVVRMDLCGSISYDTITVYAYPLGVNTVSTNQNSLRVYPNPCNDELRIRNYELGIRKIEVIDLLGRNQLVNEQMSRLENEKQSDYRLLNTANLPSGIYFIKATDEKGIIHLAKFVKE